MNFFDTASRLRATQNLKLIDALHYATAHHAGCVPQNTQRSAQKTQTT
jgi:predicted nucleic acid-binding protein